GGRPNAQARLHLDAAERVDMHPDLLWRRDGKPAAVIDAKYKAERPEGFPNADLYQMLAYCTVLELGDGHLIYAKGNEPAALHAIQHSNVTVHCHALDLTLPPQGLLAQITHLAKAIAETSAA